MENKDMQQYWNEDYWKNCLKKNENKNLDFLEDIWIKKHEDILKKVDGNKALDLGCGLGQYSEYLYNLGFDVTSCDISNVVLEKLSNRLSNVKTQVLDMSKKFPFTDNSFDLIVANLSIHYFDEETTFKVLDEIRRVLKDDGIFIGSVNSTKTYQFIEDSAIELDNNFYFSNGKYVRLWDKEQFDYFFREFNIISLKEVTTERWNKIKIQWEFIVSKK